MKFTAIIERDGFASKRKNFDSLSAANESAAASIRMGADRVTVRNYDGVHCRTYVKTGPGNHKPKSYTFSNGQQVWTR